MEYQLESRRIEELTDYVLEMKRLRFDAKRFDNEEDALGKLGKVLCELAQVMDKWYRDQTRILEITEKINQGIFLNDVLDYVYDTFRPVIPYDRIGFALVEEDNRVVRSYWSRSDFREIRIGVGYAQKLEGSSLSKILETGECRVLNDLEAYYQDHPKSDSTRLILAEGIRSSLTCPLIAMGRPIGFVFFSSKFKNTYENIHQDLFGRIASQLAVIVEKSRLYEDLHRLNAELVEARNSLQHQASHDGLTGLWNHNAILECLDTAVAQANRSKGFFAVIMADIDHFKALNDQYGHQVGDVVLKEVAHRLAHAARRGDIVGRYGGEEFLIVLSHSNIAGAKNAAERYRNAIANTPVTVQGVEISVTISLGVSVSSDSDSLNGETILKSADKALYAAKNTGRDCIKVDSI